MSVVWTSNRRFSAHISRIESHRCRIGRHLAGHSVRPANGYPQVQTNPTRHGRSSRRLFGAWWMDRPPTGLRTAAAIAGALALSLVVSCASASAAVFTTNISVSPSPVPQGGSVTISGNVSVAGGRSCPAADVVQLTSTVGLFPQDGFGPRANRDTNGNFSIEFKIPTSTPAGSYRVGVRCGGGNVGISVTLRVTRSATTTTAAGTPTVPQTAATSPPVGKRSRYMDRARRARAASRRMQRAVLLSPLRKNPGRVNDAPSATSCNTDSVAYPPREKEGFAVGHYRASDIVDSDGPAPNPTAYGFAAPVRRLRMLHFRRCRLVDGVAPCCTCSLVSRART